MEYKFRTWIVQWFVVYDGEHILTKNKFPVEWHVYQSWHGSKCELSSEFPKLPFPFSTIKI